jgi:hypothetical protein
MMTTMIEMNSEAGTTANLPTGASEPEKYIHLDISTCLLENKDQLLYIQYYFYFKKIYIKKIKLN